ncbi:hypothetical protein Ptr902_08430 [Pyrenophora tritici-repentis]|nr:hypothetical protein Ptr902_08430 [Pyrenophora tritici-repentis]
MVEYELEYPGFSHLSAPFITGPCIVLVEEKRLAAEVLARLSRLQSMTLTAKDAKICYREYSEDPGFRTSLPIFHMLPLRDQFAAIPGLSQLSSLHPSHGHLDWAIITLPTLDTLCLGAEATIQLPCKDNTAPNILTVILESQRRVTDSELNEKCTFLTCLPNLRSMTLNSHNEAESKNRLPFIHNPWELPQVPFQFGWWAQAAPHLLEHAPSVQDLVFTYGSEYGAAGSREYPLRLGNFTQLRRMQVAERIFLFAMNHNSELPYGFLSPSIQELVVDHTYFPDINVPSFYNVDWLVPVVLKILPELKQVELVVFRNDECSEW